MNETAQDLSPEDLLAKVTAEYDTYLEVADLSRVVAPSEEIDPAPAPVPLGLVLWSS